MILLAHTLTIAGTCILLASLLPLKNLIANLPPGKVRRNWQILKILIYLFILGYIIYAATTWNQAGRLLDLIVPVIFFLGASFVFLVNILSLQTALDIRRVAALEIESITDPLMGIYNRRYLDRRLKEEVDRAVRYSLPLSILLLDVDNFKSINDRYGHQTGDVVLGNLARTILSTARISDIVARYGGEEILVIGTSTPLSTAPLFAERVRTAIEASVLLPPSKSTGGEAVKMTVSIGVASIGPEVRDVDTLIRHADKALYRAKHEGRNRVVAHVPGHDCE